MIGDTKRLLLLLCDTDIAVIHENSYFHQRSILDNIGFMTWLKHVGTKSKGSREINRRRIEILWCLLYLGDDYIGHIISFSLVLCEFANFCDKNWFLKMYIKSLKTRRWKLNPMLCGCTKSMSDQMSPWEHVIKHHLNVKEMPHSFFCKIVLLRFNLPTISFTHFKYTIQWF